MHSAHHARETIDLLHQFRRTWHPNIPDLNPVDYKIWVIMQSRVYQTKISSVDERRVIDVWRGFEQPTINLAFDH